MRISNLKKVVTLTIEEDKPFVWYMSKTGGNYYIVLLHDGNMVTERYSSEEIAKKSIIIAVKKVLKSFENLSQILPAHSDLIYEYKKKSVLQFTYSGTC